MTGAAFPKEERVSDPDQLDWVRKQRCSFCPRRAPSTPHHAILKKMGGATLRDDFTIPVCDRCHRRCHGTAQPVIAPEIQLAVARRVRAQFLLWQSTDPKAVPW